MQQVYEIVSCEWKNIIKRGTLALTIPAVSTIYAHLNKCRGSERILETFIDRFIPFYNIFIIPYILWYAYVGVFLSLLCIVDKETYFRLLINLNIGMLTCYLIYYLYPTYVPRPYVESTGFFNKIVFMIYRADNPYNCFPSIHVLNSLLVALNVNNTQKLNKNLKLISSIFSIVILLSTMFVKQHYIVDVLAATVLAYIIYFLSISIKIKRKAKSCM